MSRFASELLYSIQFQFVKIFDLRVFPDAPRVGDPEPEYPLHMMHHGRSLTGGSQFSSRKRQYNNNGNNHHHKDHNDNYKRRKTRHSY